MPRPSKWVLLRVDRLSRGDRTLSLVAFVTVTLPTKTTNQQVAPEHKALYYAGMALGQGSRPAGRKSSLFLFI